MPYFPSALCGGRTGGGCCRTSGMVSFLAAQVAIQLAYWRLHQATDSVYESCSTAAFRHGRTECIRAATIESAAFVKAMDDASMTLADKVCDRGAHRGGKLTANRRLLTIYNHRLTANGRRFTAILPPKRRSCLRCKIRKKNR